MSTTSADSLLDFTGAIFRPDDIIELRLIRPRDGKPDILQKWCKARDTAQYREWLADRSDDGFNVYIGANPRNAIGATEDSNITLARCVFVDFDHCSVDEALARIGESGLPAQAIIINSGHGCHAYWLLAEPFTDLAVWTDRQKDLIALLGSDKTIHNPERIMRLPGYRNHKEPAADCALIECDPSRVYEWADLLPLIPKRKSESSNGQHHAAPINGEILDGRRNATLTSLAGSMQRRGMSDSAILSALLAENSAKCRPPLPDDEVGAIAKSIARYEPAAEHQPLSVKTESLGAIWKSDPQLREPMIDGLLRRGEVGNLISTSKSYKTYLILALAICLAVGRMWLDRFACKAGKVLIIDLELAKSSITKRTLDIARAMHIDPDTIASLIDVISLRGCNATIENVEQIILGLERRTYSAIIIDPLYKCYPDRFDENSNAQMTGLYRRWERMAEHIDGALVIVHHGSKGSQSDKRIVDVGSGASAQSRSADCHIALREHEQPDAIVFDARVRSFPPVSPMVLRWEYPLWQRDLALSPDDLKSGRRSRVADKSESRPTEPKAEPWNVDRFVAAFITDSPQTRKLVLARARQAGIPARTADDLIELAAAEKRAFVWAFDRDKNSYLASIEQPITALTPQNAKITRKNRVKSDGKGAK